MIKIERFFCYGCDCQTYHEQNAEDEYECLECGEIWDPPLGRFQSGTPRSTDGDGVVLQAVPAKD